MPHGRRSRSLSVAHLIGPALGTTSCPPSRELLLSSLSLSLSSPRAPAGPGARLGARAAAAAVDLFKAALVGATLADAVVVDAALAAAFAGAALAGAVAAATLVGARGTAAAAAGTAAAAAAAGLVTAATLAGAGTAGGRVPTPAAALRMSLRQRCTRVWTCERRTPGKSRCSKMCLAVTSLSAGGVVRREAQATKTGALSLCTAATAFRNCSSATRHDIVVGGGGKAWPTRINFGQKKMAFFNRRSTRRTVKKWNDIDQMLESNVAARHTPTVRPRNSHAKVSLLSDETLPRSVSVRRLRGGVAAGSAPAGSTAAATGASTGSAGGLFAAAEDMRGFFVCI